MHRLDYQWKRQLKTEQEQASTTKLVNKMLLQNILPHHVADVYLANRRASGRGLYSESYSSVAVMFASIPDYIDFYTEAAMRNGGVSGGIVCLRILNDIIASFDKLLFHDQVGYSDEECCSCLQRQHFQYSCPVHPRGEDQGDQLHLHGCVRSPAR